MRDLKTLQRMALIAAALSLEFACDFCLRRAPRRSRIRNRLNTRGQIVIDGQVSPYLIRRLPVTSFPDLPESIQTVLDRRGCLVPQTYEAHHPENVVHASLERHGSSDWAVLCSANGTVSLLVFFASATLTILSVASAPGNRAPAGARCNRTFSASTGPSIRPLAEPGARRPSRLRSSPAAARPRCARRLAVDRPHHLPFLRKEHLDPARNALAFQGSAPKPSAPASNDRAAWDYEPRFTVHDLCLSYSRVESFGVSPCRKPFSSPPFARPSAARPRALSPPPVLTTSPQPH